MAVSVSICEIFSVKEWRDLEKQVKGRSRSLKMARIDRPCMTFYGSTENAGPENGGPKKMK